MNLNDLYKDYSARYDRMEAQTEYPIAITKFNKIEFKAMFEPQKIELEERLHRKVTESEVIREMVLRNKYGSSVRQGTALQNAAAKLGIHIDEETARYWQAKVHDWKEDGLGLPLEEITDPAVRKFFEYQQQKIEEYFAKHPNATNTNGLSAFIAKEVWGS